MYPGCVYLIAMSGNTAEMVLPVEQGNVGIEEGDTCTGVIIGTEVRTVEHSDGKSDYYEIQVREESTDLELDTSYNARVTPGTDLGKTLQRFGVELEVGEDIALHEVFENGTKVEFEVVEQEGDERTFLDIDKHTLRAAGAGKEVVEEQEVEVEEEESDGSSNQSGDGEDDGPVELGEEAEQALEVIEEEGLEGEEPKAVKRALAQESGTLIKGYKELVEAGEIYVNDDEVNITP